MSRSIELVVHCFSTRHDCYAKMLTAQISSLIKWRPKCDYNLMVCMNDGDDLTFTALRLAFAHGVSASAYPLDLPHLFRRGIGRNNAAQTSKADIVWHCDCDLLFGEGCLDALAASDFTGLAFPRTQLVHRAHWIGDRDLTQIKLGQLWEPNPADFEPNKIKFASGGVIIVDGATARKGFMHGTKWTEPVDPARGFCDPREDIAYRKTFEGKSTVLDLPNLFRFRHSACPFQKPEDRLAQTAHVK